MINEFFYCYFMEMIMNNIDLNSWATKQLTRLDRELADLAQSMMLAGADHQVQQRLIAAREALELASDQVRSA